MSLARILITSSYLTVLCISDITSCLVTGEAYDECALITHQEYVFREIDSWRQCGYMFCLPSATYVNAGGTAAYEQSDRLQG